MSQSELKPQPISLNIKFADASNLPVSHVNAVSVHSGTDEFFFTVGVAVPPSPEELAVVAETGHLIAQPIYRFAMSRDTMEKILQLMAEQFEQQTALRNEFHQQMQEDK